MFKRDKYCLLLLMIFPMIFMLGCQKNDQSLNNKSATETVSVNEQHQKSEESKEPKKEPEKSVYDMGYPRYFQFRNATEGVALKAGYTYDQWKSLINKDPGIMGKLFDEEIPGREEKVKDFFIKFKDEYPDKLVMLHYIGVCTILGPIADDYFAGHWLYYNGSIAQNDIPAQSSETIIKVSDPSLYRTKIGSYENENDHIALIRLKDDGSPDWFYVEQVRLVSVDKKADTITVERGFANTKPLAFEAGKTRVAAHIFDGPSGGQPGASTLMWVKNLSTYCPKDANGKTAADIYVEQLTREFTGNGPLAKLDGVQFDVLYNNAFERAEPSTERGVDVDGDSIVDHGYVNGENSFAQGVTIFLEKLRAALGPDKIIAADGQRPNMMRGVNKINGVEMEGWPDPIFDNFSDWSGGINRLLFWRDHTINPAFNYIVQKILYRGKYANMEKDQLRHIRMIDAVAVLGDYMIATQPIVNEKGSVRLETPMIHVDEILNGKANQKGWLGQPAGPMVRIAKQLPDLLGGNGAKELTEKTIAPSATDISKVDKRLFNQPDFPVIGSRVFTHSGFQSKGGDVTMFFTIKAEPIKNYSVDYPRLVWICVKDKTGKIIEKYNAWANQKENECSAYIRDLPAGNISVELFFEGQESAAITSFTVHESTDAMYREFENGAVFINPSYKEYTFDIASLLPDKQYRRIDGMADPEVNNGQDVRVTLTLSPVDALFLVKK